MIPVLQIGFGIWLGGVLLIGSALASIAVAEKIKSNRSRGRPWWHELHDPRGYPR